MQFNNDEDRDYNSPFQRSYPPYLYTHNLGVQPPAPTPLPPTSVVRIMKTAYFPVWIKILGWIALFFLMAEYQPGSVPPAWLLAVTWSTAVLGVLAFLVDSIRLHPQAWKMLAACLGLVVAYVIIRSILSHFLRYFGQEIAQGMRTAQSPSGFPTP